MKKILILGFALLAMVSCKKSEEVKIDHTEQGAPADTIVQKDTIAAVNTSVEETDKPAEIIENSKAALKDVKVTAASDVKVDFASFGSKINADKALSKEEMLKKYAVSKKGIRLL